MWRRFRGNCSKYRTGIVPKSLLVYNCDKSCIVERDKNWTKNPMCKWAFRVRMLLKDAAKTARPLTNPLVIQCLLFFSTSIKISLSILNLRLWKYKSAYLHFLWCFKGQTPFRSFEFYFTTQSKTTMTRRHKSHTGPFHLISTPPDGRDFLRGPWPSFLRGSLCRRLWSFKYFRGGLEKIGFFRRGKENLGTFWRGARVGTFHLWFLRG